MQKEIEEELTDSDELYEKLSLVIAKGQEPLRIDKFLMARIEGATRNKIQQAIASELVLVNDKPIKNNYKVKGGDKLVIFDSNAPETSEIIPQNIPLDIVYEDEDLFVVNKPVGMVVHPGSGNPDGTLINAVAYYLKNNVPGLDENELPRYGLVHRIDKNTSGLIVLAKSQKAMSDLAKQFFDHTVHRRYVAVVWGNFDEDEGTIVAHVGRHQRFRKLFTAYPEGEHGKDAITHYKVLERFNYVTLVECRLETGRTHQIRVHMAHVGCPVVGDPVYAAGFRTKEKLLPEKARAAVAALGRQALHAAVLAFPHPITGEEMRFESPAPADFRKAAKALTAL